MGAGLLVKLSCRGGEVLHDDYNGRQARRLPNVFGPPEEAAPDSADVVFNGWTMRRCTGVYDPQWFAEVAMRGMAVSCGKRDWGMEDGG